MRRALTIAFAALLVAGGAWTLVGSGGGDGDDPEPARGEPRPGGGVSLVAGRAERLSLVPTLLDPLDAPVTVLALVAGDASARIGPVLVDGREQTVAWQGGTPLVIEATVDTPGALTLDPVHVEASADGLDVLLDGAAGRLAAGRYQAIGSVVLGAGGLGRSAEAVAFEATDATLVSFGGTAVVRLDPDALTLEGPGEVRLTGDVELTSGEADRRLVGLEFGPGPYRFDLVWLDERLEVEGRLDGEVRPLPPPRLLLRAEGDVRPRTVVPRRPVGDTGRRARRTDRDRVRAPAARHAQDDPPRRRPALRP